MNSHLLILVSLFFITPQSSPLSMQSKIKANPKDYLPTSIGAKWVYENKYLSDVGQSHPQLVTVMWTSEISITAISDVPEGELVARSIQIKNTKYDFPPDISPEQVNWFKQNFPGSSIPLYLIADSYVYEVPQAAVDQSRMVLTDAFRKGLKEGEIVPIYFFPIEAVRMWAERKLELADIRAMEEFTAGKGPAPNPGMYYWTNQGIEDLTLPFGKVSGAFRLAYRTNPDSTNVWFKSGIGLVKESSYHHGTRIESESQLVSYSLPAKR